MKPKTIWKVNERRWGRRCGCGQIAYHHGDRAEISCRLSVIRNSCYKCGHDDEVNKLSWPQSKCVICNNIRYFENYKVKVRNLKITKQCGDCRKPPDKPRGLILPYLSEIYSKKCKLCHTDVMYSSHISWELSPAKPICEKCLSVVHKNKVKHLFERSCPDCKSIIDYQSKLGFALSFKNKNKACVNCQKL